MKLRLSYGDCERRLIDSKLNKRQTAETLGWLALLVSWVRGGPNNAKINTGLWLRTQDWLTYWITALSYLRTKKIVFHIEYLIFIRFGMCFVLSSCRNTNSWKSKTNISWILITVPLISVVAPFTPTHVKKHSVEWHFTDVQYAHCKCQHSLLFIYMLILSAPLWHCVNLT